MAFTGNYICTSFKSQLLAAKHDFTAHTFKIALYTNSASLSASTTAYSATGETAGTNYSAGGVALSGAAISASGTTVMVSFSNATFTNVSITARGALIYNSTTGGNPAVAVLDFGADKTRVAADLVITLPPVDVDNALIRLV